MFFCGAPPQIPELAHVDRRDKMLDDIIRTNGTLRVAGTYPNSIRRCVIACRRVRGASLN